MVITYTERQKLGDYRVKDQQKQAEVLSILYESAGIVCYRLNSFEVLTLCKETDAKGKIYLIK